MLFILPLLDALIMGLVVYSAIHWYFRMNRLRPLIAHAMDSLEEQLHRKLENADIQADVDALLEQRLDALILIFKQQIPMASMLLSGALAEKFKGQAKEEILKMLPGLKQRLLDRFSKEVDIKEWVFTQIREFAIEKQARRVSLYAALLGLLIGLINVAIIAFFHV
jgi:hypothetical protein